MLKTLENLGLTQPEARVYVFLAKRGPQKARDTAKHLEIPKPTVYLIIKKLQKKGIVTSTLERPARFNAVPFEEVLDLFVKAKMEEAQQIQQNRDRILSDWQSISIGEIADGSAKFMIIEGRNYIYSKIQKMMTETKKQLSIMATVTDLIRADQFGVFDATSKQPSKSKVNLKFITELSEQNLKAMKTLLNGISKTRFNFEGRTPDLGLKVFSRMIIKDEKEALFFLNPKMDSNKTEKDYVCLWTNCKALVDAFLGVFRDLWRQSTDVQKKILEIETGKPAQKTCIINDAQTAKKKYYATLEKATEKILIVTSAKGLIGLSKSLAHTRESTARGVSVQIMAPIVGENRESARQLSECCEVRHIPATYLGTTIIDGKHLFQFKNPPSSQENSEGLPYFENAFYTNDHEYIAKTENMLRDIWENANVLSGVTLESIVNPSSSAEAPFSGRPRHSPYRLIDSHKVLDKNTLGAVTEKDVLRKIINAKRIPVKNPFKETVRYYGSSAMALIHPPKHFNIPEMLIAVSHWNDQSSFGAENWISIYLRRESPKGSGVHYVPAGGIMDNPETEVIAFRKTMLARAYADIQAKQGAQKYQVVKKDKLDVRLQGNILFAGWTVPISLFPDSYTLPPSCILFEGYGNVKTGAHVSLLPNGRKRIIEWNRLEAFVTFFHPSSKYAGPGTDGFIDRDNIFTSTP